MVDDRNLTSHTYREEVAIDIYRRVRDYWDLMDSLPEVVKKLDSDFKS
jgi:hypothetical protein